MGSNSINDTLAIAAMPGLEEMAEAIGEADKRKRKSATDPRSLLILAGASRAFKSQESAATALKHNGLWEQARASAARVGRLLPEAPPTPDQLDKMLSRSGEAVALAAERALESTAMDLAHGQGWLMPTDEFEFRPPSRANHLTADGTVMKTLSSLTEEDRVPYDEATGRKTRSRAADPSANARICNQLVGKPPTEEREDKRRLGVPFVVVSMHHGLQYQRLIFGFELYQDGDEARAALALLDRVIPLADGGVDTVNYDMLFDNSHVHHLHQRHGVVPIVAMRQPSKGGLAIPATDDRFRRGKHGQHAPKPRVRAWNHGLEGHDLPDGTRHWDRLWSIDGAPYASCVDDKKHSRDFRPMQLVDIERVREGDRWKLLVTYVVPCSKGHDFTRTVDMAAEPPTGDCKAIDQLSGGRVRIINERNPHFHEVSGRRSDSESTIDEIKRTMYLRGRATRLTPHGFLFDLVGSALFVNARCWDVHVAQHTPLGRDHFDRLQRTKVAA